MRLDGLVFVVGGLAMFAAGMVAGSWGLDGRGKKHSTGSPAVAERPGPERDLPVEFAIVERDGTAMQYCTAWYTATETAPDRGFQYACAPGKDEYSGKMLGLEGTRGVRLVVDKKSVHPK